MKSIKRIVSSMVFAVIFSLLAVVALPKQAQAAVDKSFVNKNITTILNALKAGTYDGAAYSDQGIVLSYTLGTNPKSVVEMTVSNPAADSLTVTDSYYKDDVLQYKSTAEINPATYKVGQTCNFQTSMLAGEYTAESIQKEGNAAVNAAMTIWDSKTVPNVVPHLSLRSIGFAAMCETHTNKTVVVKKATCTVNGTKRTICDYCGTYTDQVIKAGHDFTIWRTITAATVFKKGSQGRFCKTCELLQTKNIAKLKPVIKISPKGTLKLKVKKSKVVKVTKMAKGDAVKSFKSSNKAVATVSKKGKIVAKKPGTATITVTLKSKKTAKLKVKVVK